MLLLVIACILAFVAAGYYFVSIFGPLEGLMVLAAVSTLLYILWLVGLYLFSRGRWAENDEGSHVQEYAAMILRSHV